jgi:hypothetical protein
VVEKFSLLGGFAEEMAELPAGGGVVMVVTVVVVVVVEGRR